MPCCWAMAPLTPRLDSADVTPASWPPCRRGQPLVLARRVILALTLLLGGAGCAGSAISAGGSSGAERTSARRSGARDLLSLVPDGAHLLVAVDLRRWRQFSRGEAGGSGQHTAERLLGASARSYPLADRLLPHTAVLVAAAWLSDAGVAQVLLLARGSRALGQALPSPVATAPNCASPYRGVALRCDRGAGLALLDPRTVISGSLPLVRYSIDLLRNLPGRASAREDRTLMALWRLITGPRAGRAPVVAAVVRLPEGVEQRLAKALGLQRAMLRGALRMSVATDVTVRALLDCRNRHDARRLVLALGRQVTRLARSRIGRALGLDRLLALLLVHPEGARVWIQWIARASRLRGLLGRLDRLLGSHAGARPSGADEQPSGAGGKPSDRTKPTLPAVRAPRPARRAPWPRRPHRESGGADRRDQPDATGSSDQ